MQVNYFLRYRENFIKNCKCFYDKTAITYMRDNGTITKTTFGQILDGCTYISELMLKAGVVPGDRVAIIAPHSPQSVLVSLGLAYANITAVLIDASLPTSEINRLLAFSDVQGCYITNKLFLNVYNEFKKNIPFFELCSKENQYRLFANSVITSQKEKTLDPETDVIAILYSSGTTAQMKGIKVTYNSVLMSSDIFIRNVEWKAEYSYLHVFPLNHIAGYATVQAFLSCGSELGMIENMTATKLQDALLKYNPYGFGMIPKVFEMMEDKIRLILKQKGFLAEKAVLALMVLSAFLRKNFGCMIGRKWLNFVTKQIFGDNIVAIGTGASLCRPSTSKFFLDLGLYWTNNYASTETNVPATSTGNFDRYPVGMAGYAKRNPEIEIKINNPDQNGIGEIYINSQLLMKGYFRDDDLTRQSYDGQYFKTGDYGYIDKKGNLFVTGRVKESILLHTGKKVSPTDVENYYKAVCDSMQFACCGYANKDSNYDDIHLFIQTKGVPQEEINKTIERIHSLSSNTANLYRLSSIHKIDTLPMTSIGKIKRFELQKLICSDGNNFPQNAEYQTMELKNMPVEFAVCELIKQKILANIDISLQSNLQHDLGLDSLMVLELDIRIQEVYGVSAVNDWLTFETVLDLVTYIKNKMCQSEETETYNYPMLKSDEDIVYFMSILSKIESFCDIQYIGLENIPVTPCVFTPNHSSHLDTLTVYGAIASISEERLYKMCCLAAKELAESPEVEKFFAAIGAIPVDRKSNSAAALKAMQKAISESGHSALIYPEGTRTRTGKMGVFLDGASIVCHKTNTPAIPVSIKGAYEIWPPHCDSPNRLSKKQKVVVKFGKPIYPSDYSIKQLTEEIEKSVIRLCEE